MSRQRLRPSLGESSQETCPRCDGHGTIRSIESLALSILRLLEEEAMKEHTGQVVVQAPPQVANFLLNEKRKALSTIESRQNVPILILSNEYMQRPRFEIERVRKSDVSDDPSYMHVQKPAENTGSDAAKAQQSHAGPAVAAISPTRPAPSRETAQEKPQSEPAKPGLLGKLFPGIFGKPAEPEKPEPPRHTQWTPPSDSEMKSTETAAPANSTSSTTARPASQKPNRRKRPARNSADPANTGGRPPRKKTGKKTGKKKRVRKKKSAAKKVADGNETNTNQNPNANQADADPASKPASGDAKPPAKNRRRRSRYKTGGGKPRDDQDANTKDNANASDNNAANDNQASKGNGHSPKPQQPDQQQVDRPQHKESAPAPAASAKKADTESASDRAAKPAVEVSKDDKGIYTLKPAENPRPAATERSTPPAPSGGDQ
jgi:ribonuclease E